MNAMLLLHNGNVSAADDDGSVATVESNVSAVNGCSIAA